MTNESGILSFGAYVPRLRLARKAIAAANAWFNPGLRALAKGERAMANWDEDAVTMSVEAARDCLAGFDRGTVAAVTLASTTHPFDDRQNSGILANALNLRPALRVLDVAGSPRAGTSALAAAFAAASGSAEPALVAAGEHRLAKAASTQEMQYGDGAAAVLIGGGQPLARLLGTHSETVDFVPQFRAHDRAYDYAWEERWIRDEGYLKIVPRTLAALFKATGMEPGAVTHLCLPCTLPRVTLAVAKRAGIAESAVRDNLAAVCGDTGAAHPLLMLVHALEDANPGDTVLLASFAEGCDALLFQVTDEIKKFPARRGVKGSLARRNEETTYGKLLAFNDSVQLERGMRAEVDKGTPLSVLYRNREMITGLVGGRCRACGTVQYPRGRYCVNPGCNALDSQDDQPFAELAATVKSYTADSLTYSPDPPAYYGMIDFNGGGRMMIDFTDVDEGKLEVGTPMRMMFRIKDYDAVRGFVRYFWKAAPA
ncbi:MAG: 3-hydroxy-3-methylglutaryl CoA synthase [Betaproteobacteria bacterium RIFCSPLOWO2_12_FULL_65_14]|nr:MAG: 3-hydroxy-3-methylglutaryl CoA synthase [Betaproteobacteria bacterium RIFCSPLOWO2_12_FULL_65_14]